MQYFKINQTTEIPSLENDSQIISNSEQTPYNGRLVWICSQVALCIMTLILVYICTCLAWFLRSGCKKKGKVRTDSTRGGRGLISWKRSRYRMWMRVFCLFAAVSVLAKCLADQLKFFYAWNAKSDDICELVYDITDIILFSFGYFGVYGFLWIKQWLFYCDPVAVKFLYNKKLVIFNRLFVGFMIVLGVVCAGFNWNQRRYRVSNITENEDDTSFTGCIAVYEMSDTEQRGPLVFYTVLNVTFQVVLMLLFIYPVGWDKWQKWKTKAGSAMNNNIRNANVLAKPGHSEGKNSTLESENTTVTIGRRHVVTNSERSLSEKALKSIWRTIIFTAICILTDTTLVAIFAIKSKGTPLVLVAIATDFDLLINVICIIGTYQTWKNIIFPFHVTGDVIQRKQNSSVNMSSQA